MRKLRLLFKIFGIVVLLTGLQSCKKDKNNDCITCKYDDDDSDDFKICEDDEDEWGDYADSWDDVVDALNEWDDEESDVSCN
jgi:hypothetical protein